MYELKVCFDLSIIILSLLLWWCLKTPCLLVLQVCRETRKRLSTETVESAALSLESVHNVKSSDGLSAGVLSVGDSVTDDVLKEDLEDTTGLLVDKTRDALDTTTAGKSANSRLGNALDVIPEHLAVALSTALS